MIAGKKKKGIRGEVLAARYLREQGYQMVNGNYRTHLGEVDIIALEEDVLVFFEVKTRTPDSFGQPLDSVDHHKQRRILAAAKQFTASRRYTGAVRFDVLEVLLHRDESGEIRHIKDAFDEEPSFGQGR
jgi:putative endonuclease